MDLKELIQRRNFNEIRVSQLEEQIQEIKNKFCGVKATQFDKLRVDTSLVNRDTYISMLAKKESLEDELIECRFDLLDTEMRINAIKKSFKNEQIDVYIMKKIDQLTYYQIYLRTGIPIRTAKRWVKNIDKKDKYIEIISYK